MIDIELPDAEVIDLRPREGVEPKMRVKRASACFCSLELDEKERTVTCPRCGRRWEPFAALLMLSRAWTSYACNRDALRHEVRKLVEQRDRLRQDVANLKAQARRVRGEGGR